MTIRMFVKAGYTPLHSACHFGQINMIRFLLENGASVNASTKVTTTTTVAVVVVVVVAAAAAAAVYRRRAAYFTVRLHAMQRKVLLSKFCLSVCLSVSQTRVL